jgi:hypothetical protein
MRRVISQRGDLARSAGFVDREAGLGVPVVSSRANPVGERAGVGLGRAAGEVSNLQITDLLAVPGR